MEESLTVFGVESLPGTGRALALVGAVLVESLVLYVGYGGLAALLGPRLVRALAAE